MKMHMIDSLLIALVRVQPVSVASANGAVTFDIVKEEEKEEEEEEEDVTTEAGQQLPRRLDQDRDLIPRETSSMFRRLLLLMLMMMITMTIVAAETVDVCAKGKTQRNKRRESKATRAVCKSVAKRVNGRASERASEKIKAGGQPPASLSP